MLSDQIRDSLIKGQHGRTELGLDTLRRVLSEAPRAYRRIHTNTSASNNPTMGYGPEWDALILSTLTVQNAGSESEHALVRQSLLSFLFRILTDALEAGEFFAARSLSEPLIKTWSDMTTKNMQWTDDESSYFLLRLGEIASSGHAGGDDPLRERHTALILTRVFVKSAKEAIDGDALPEGALELIEIFNDRVKIAGNNERGEHLRDLFSGALLVLLAWLLFKTKGRDPKNSATNTTLRRIIEFARPETAWTGLHCAHGDDLQNELRWTWWEMPPLRGRAVAGVLELSTYIDLAALIVMTHRGVIVPPETDGLTIATSRRLLSLLDQVGDDCYPVVSSLLTGREARSQTLREQLMRKTEIDDDRRAKTLANAPLDEIRIELFRKSVERSYRENPTILDALTEISTIPDNQPDKNLFGVNRLQDKAWFVETDVHADPSMLGKDLAKAVRTGETQLLADALKTLPSTPVEGAESCFELAKLWLRKQERGHQSILVTNSFEAAQAFTTGNDLNEPARSTELGIDLYRIYADTDPFVAALNTSSGISATRRKVAHARNGDTLVNDDLLLIGVDSLTEPEIHQVLEVNSDLKEIDVRQLVLVRVLISVTLSVSDPDGIRVWQLPASAA